MAERSYRGVKPLTARPIPAFCRDGASNATDHRRIDVEIGRHDVEVAGQNGRRVAVQKAFWRSPSAVQTSAACNRISGPAPDCRSAGRGTHWGDALMVALAGVGNGIAQFWWTRSLSLAPPSAVVPFNYLSLVWATILGFAVWGEVPTSGLLVGSAIVVASGLYILWRETLRRRRPAVPALDRA
jgi:hypothetical protein